ncbi:Biotin synthesis protein bioK [Prochlorococcus sp. MIT 0602]|nr:Biotin synthesis protein bioK [Prochlorococcus sp. MIT 0602]
MHGWCGDSTYWINWENHFKNNGWLWQNSERGYGYINSYQPLWEENLKSSNKHRKVLLCHSLGMHLIPKQILSEASDIILLNSFSRFIPNSKKSRAIKVGLQGMQKHFFTSTEEAMLLKFLIKASDPYPINQSLKGPLNKGISLEGRKKLITDLNMLINTNGLPPGLTKQTNVLVVNGADDKIIGTSTTNELLRDLRKYLHSPPIHWIVKGQGHFIDFSKVITKINSWLLKAQ